MADVRDVHSVFAVKLLLEGKDHDHLADVHLDLLHAPATPRPDLRADKIENRNTEAVELARQTEVEVREVDEHGCVGLAPCSFCDHALESPADIRQMLNDFRQSNDRDVSRVDQQLATGSMHLVSAHAEEPCIGRNLL